MDGRGDPSDASRILTGLAVCKVDLCELESARRTLERALALAARVNDDSRSSIITANMCMVDLMRGALDSAVDLGLQSIDYAGKTGLQPTLGQTYLNLSQAYALLGNLDAASECQAKARAWLQQQRNWKTNAEFLWQSAYSALGRGNEKEALDLIGAAEQYSLGRERAISPPVGIGLLKIFKAAHVGEPTEALKIALSMRRRYQDGHPLLFLDATAGVAWLEAMITGKLSDQTRSDLAMFEALGVKGRRLEFVQAGFIRDDIVGVVTKPVGVGARTTSQDGREPPI
jgi:tetratricopeptide (TPR) repeat protein